MTTYKIPSVAIGFTPLKPYAEHLAKMQSEPLYRKELDALINANLKIAKANFANTQKKIAFLEQMNSASPAHLIMPHPQRAKLSNNQLITYLSLGEFAFATIYYAAKAGLTIQDALALAKKYDAEAAHNLAGVSSRAGGINDGNNVVTAAPLYHQFRNGATLIFEDNLMRELQLTDISNGVSADLIIPPFDSCFIAFGETPDALDPTFSLFNSESGIHQLEGAYINQYKIEHPADSILPDFYKPLELHAKSDVICLEVLFTGRPKDRMLNDSSHHANLYFDLNSDSSVTEQLERNLLMYAVMSNSEIAERALTPETRRLLMDDLAKQQLTHNFNLLTKLLVYLNCADVRKEKREPTKELAKQLARTLNAKKARRIESELRATIDYTLITGYAERLDFNAGMSDGTGKRPHWRRGFLRNQRFGKGRAEVRLTHIRPVLVNKSQLGKGTLPAKNYKVK